MMTSAWNLQNALCLLLLIVAGQTLGQEETPASLSGFESSELYGVEDNVALDPADQMLHQLVYRSRSVSHESLDRFSQFSKNVDDGLLMDKPQDHRFWVFRRKATVTRIARKTLPDDLATEEFGEYWLLIAKQDQQTVAIVSRTIPATWRRLESLAEPIEFAGFFFGLKKLGNLVDSKESVPVFVCDRVSWYPDRELEKGAIGPSQLYLASHGVDLGYLDLVKKNQKRKMLAEEGDIFYQILAAAAQSQEDLAAVNDLKPIGFLELIQHPDEHVGQVVEIEGRVRRIVEVPITSEERREQLGIDHFYEMDMYVSLNDVATIRATDKDGKEVVYKDRFPVTVHLTSLPELEDEYRHHKVRVRGFFYRLWSYQSEYAKKTNQGSQLSPLLIGFKPTVLRASTKMLDTILTVGGIVFVVGLLGLIWFLRKGDKGSANPLNRSEDLPEKIEIPSAG